MILAHEVLGRLAPFLRFVVASSAAGVPIPERGEIDPLGWWLMWRADSERLTIRTAMPKADSPKDREEVLIAVATLPAINGAEVAGTHQCLSVSVSLQPSELHELAAWIDRWKTEVGAHDW